MANELLNQLFEVLQGLKTDTTNLHKSLDETNAREETEGDLSSIFSRFSDLQEIMSQLDETDVAELKTEVKKLFSGQEDLATYTRDVNNILAKVKQRVQQHAPTKEKVVQNLPDDQKGQNVGTIFNDWQSTLSAVQQFIEQYTSTKAGSR